MANTTDCTQIRLTTSTVPMVTAVEILTIRFPLIPSKIRPRQLSSKHILMPPSEQQ